MTIRFLTRNAKECNDDEDVVLLGEKVQSVKILGIQIDQKLGFKEHFTAVTNKAEVMRNNEKELYIFKILINNPLNFL